MLELFGGPESAVSHVDAAATSFAHRDKLLVHQFATRGPGNYYEEQGFDLMARLRESVVHEADDWGLYVNYLDTEFDPEASRLRHWGGNLARLERIKARVDGDDVFWNPQGIRPRNE